MADTEYEAEGTIPDPWSLPLETFDVSKAEIFLNNKQGEYFRRLRKEAPVHYCPESSVGAYWSVTKYHDIIAVDSNHKTFSSDPSIVIAEARHLNESRGGSPRRAEVSGRLDAVEAQQRRLVRLYQALRVRVLSLSETSWPSNSSPVRRVTRQFWLAGS